MGRRSTPVLAFAAGLASGMLTSQKQKSEDERQAKMDKIVQDKADRDTQDYNDKAAIEKQISGVATTDNKSATALTADDLMAARPDLFQDKETAQNFIDNQAATNEQKAGVISDYAKMGLPVQQPTPLDAPIDGSQPDAPTNAPTDSDGIATQVASQGISPNGRQIAATKDGLVSQDADQTTQRKPWQILQDKSSIYLASGKPEYQDAAIKTLQYSQQLKSDDYKNQIVAARQKGLDGLLDLMHNHDNGELGIVNPKI